MRLFGVCPARRPCLGGLPKRPCNPTKNDVYTFKGLPEQPAAHNYGLLPPNYGLLLGIVACYFGLVGFPGNLLEQAPMRATVKTTSRKRSTP